MTDKSAPRVRQDTSTGPFRTMGRMVDTEAEVAIAQMAAMMGRGPHAE